MNLPSHQQLGLPLLEALGRHGPLSPKVAADAVADAMRLDPCVRDAKQAMPSYSRGGVNLFERRLRWVRQSFVRQGLIHAHERARWELAELGHKFRQEARPGFALSVFETPSGLAVWAEMQTAMGLLGDGEVQAVVSSPPFPIIGGREYGRFTPEACIELVEEMFAGLKRVLRPDGSVVINLADVWEKGQPTRSLYQEELLLKLVREHGFKLCDRWSWASPSKPACSDWVTKRRERVRSATETFFWLSPTAHPYADNRNVLVPYGETMRRTLARGGDRRASRPSGHGHTGASYTNDNGGAIPPNYFLAPNSTASGAYMAHCRRLGLPIHPARFPENGVTDFFVKFLSRPGDLMADFFGGSLKLGETAERLGRRWFTCERDLRYIRGGEGRFIGIEGAHSRYVPGEPRGILPLPA